MQTAPAPSARQASAPAGDSAAGGHPAAPASATAGEVGGRDAAGQGRGAAAGHG